MAASGNTRNIVFGSMGVAGLMGLLAILDLSVGQPFGGLTVMDVLFLISTALIIYMGIDHLKELS